MHRLLLRELVSQLGCFPSNKKKMNLTIIVPKNNIFILLVYLSLSLSFL